MIYVICVFLAAVFFTIWRLNRPVLHKNLHVKDLPKFVNGLIVKGGNNTVLYIEPMNNGEGRFIQLIRYLDPKNSINNVSFEFPDASWSKIFYRNMIKRMDKEGISYRIVSGNSSIVHNYMIIDGLLAIEDCMNVISIGLEVLDIDSNCLLKAYYEGTIRDDYLSDIKTGKIKRNDHFPASSESAPAKTPNNKEE